MPLKTILMGSLLGPLFEKVIGKISDKGIDIAEKKLSKMLDLKEAGRSTDDERYYNSAKRSLSDLGNKSFTRDQIKEIVDFEFNLRRNNKEEAEAFVLFISGIVHDLEREVQTVETITSKDGHNSYVKKKTYKEIDRTGGEKDLYFFLRELLDIKGSTDEETFKLRRDFLKGSNVFSIIPPKKEGKSEIEKGMDGFYDAIQKKVKEFGREINTGAKKIKKTQGENLCDLNEKFKKIKSWNETQRRRRK